VLEAWEALELHLGAQVSHQQRDAAAEGQVLPGDPRLLHDKGVQRGEISESRGAVSFESAAHKLQVPQGRKSQRLAAASI
jgi:hypothetical protein